jgi:hypothetical protein
MTGKKKNFPFILSMVIYLVFGVLYATAIALSIDGPKNRELYFLFGLMLFFLYGDIMSLIYRRTGETKGEKTPRSVAISILVRIAFFGIGYMFVSWAVDPTTNVITSRLLYAIAAISMFASGELAYSLAARELKAKQD